MGFKGTLEAKVKSISIKKKGNYRINTAEKTQIKPLRQKVFNHGFLIQILSLFLSITIIACAFFGGRILVKKVKNNKTFKLEAVEIKGNSKISKDEIIKIALPEKDFSIFDVDSSRIKKRLLRHPLIKDAKIIKNWPHRLTIEISERVLCAEVLIEGDLYHADENGEIFERHKNDEKISVPIITGINKNMVVTNRKMAFEEIKRLIEFKNLYKRMGVETYAPISQIHREEGGGITVFTGEDAKEIRFGSGNYLERLKNLVAVLKYLKSAGRNWNYILVDSPSRPHRLVAKLE